MNKDLLPMLCGHAYQTMPYNPANEKAEVKLNGWRAIVESDGDFTRVWGGRNSADYTGRVPYLEEELANLLPPGTVVDGELVSVNDWGQVQSIMTTQKPHEPRTKVERLRFYMFDVLKVGGTDARSYPWDERRVVVEALATGSALVRPTVLIPSTQTALDMAVSSGFEGVVIKGPKSPYLNKRSKYWTKVKPQLTLEAKIIGFKEGKKGGAWEGKVGAFEVELIDTGVKTTIKCGTDARHEDATQHPDKWLGRIIEIKHHGLFESGVPRHPQWGRLRTDLEILV